MAGVAVAAVLALVIVGVVVACNGPTPKHTAAQHQSTSPGAASSSGAPSISASPKHSRSHKPSHGKTKARVTASFSGTGTGKTRHFAVLGTGDWTLAWSYTCPASVAAGSFVVSEDGNTDINGVHLSEHGTSGHGQTKVFGDVGHHSLSVVTKCSWRLAVDGKW